MTAPPQLDDLTDRDDFEDHLQHLVAIARDNDVPIKGVYDIRSPHPKDRDYQLEITEVASKTQLANFSGE